MKARWSREEMEAARQRIHAALESTSPEVRGPERLGIRPVTRSMPSPAAFGPAFRAAAVLSRFRLDELPASDASEMRRLQEQSIPLRDEGWRTLAPELRNAVLRELSRDALAALLAAYARAGDPLQTALAKALQGLKTDTLRTMTTGELAALMQVYDGIASSATLPPRDEIERKLQLARLLDPLRQITRTFSGRAAEMQALRDYVGVLSTGSWIADGLRSLGNAIFTPTPTPPLVIYGPGGVGKTTLTAQFILEHALAAEQQRFPFAYLDFDRPTVNAEEVPTLLSEAIRQIGLQYDAAFHASERLRDRWETRLSAPTAAGIDTYVKDFAGFLETLEAREGPVLLVLDTFEEVQRRSEAYVGGVLQLVSLLTSHVPRLRVVIAGRTMVTNAHVARQLELAAFDHTSALAYLQANGIDPDFAERIAALTRGNPLTLTLAIDLYRRDPESLRGFDTAQLSDEIIQSLLFDRILLHISDPEVRLLAHPGLVLRRVTPEIIQQVLAGPCEIAVPDAARAEELFNKLAEDNTLVTRVEPRELIHRADVRRMMLGPLRDHQPEKVREIHRGAIAFYETATDLSSRAETAYHRLSLGEETELTDDLEPLLVNAIDDLPLPSQAALATRYGVELSEAARQAADQDTWERIVARRLDEQMRTIDPDDLSSILAERPARSGRTELLYFEALYHHLRRDVETARLAARRGIDAYRAAGNSAELFRTLHLASLIERFQNRFEAAHSYVNDAEEIARRRDDPLMLVRALVERTFVLRREGAEVEPDLRRELASAAGRVPDATWLENPADLRNAVAEAVFEDPALVSRAIRLGVLPIGSSDLDFLARRTGHSADVVLQRIAESPTPDALEVLAAVLRRNWYERESPLPAAPSGNIKLKTAQREQLRDLLVRHYGGDLAGFLETRYSRGLESVSLSEHVPRNAMDLVRAAEREGWLNDLILGLWRSRFLSLDVLAFIDAIGLGPQVRVAKGQNAVPEKRLRALLAEHRVAIAALEARTCRVMSGDVQAGSGFLIRNNAVAAHSLAVKRTTFEFDRAVLKGRLLDDAHSVGRLWSDPSPPGWIFIEAEFAQRPLDAHRAAPGAPARGFVQVPRQPQLDPAKPVFWLWLENDGTFLSGVTRSEGPLDEAMPAMSGAPCFDAALNVVGILAGQSIRPIYDA